MELVSGSEGPARLARGLIALAGVTAILLGLALSLDFAGRYLVPAMNLRPTHLTILAGLRWAMIAAGVGLLLLAWSFHKVLGPARFAALTWTHMAQAGLFLLPLVVILVTLLVRGWLGSRNPTYMAPFYDDGPIENVALAFQFVAFGVAVVIARDFRHAGDNLLAALYAVLALGLLLIALEEISWGQRLFGVETPAWLAERNTQDEITVHNIEAVQRIVHHLYKLVGLYGTLAWLLPLAIREPRWREIAWYVAPPWYLTSYFFPVAAFYFVYDARWAFRGFEQELPEMLLSAGFLLFTVHVLLHRRAERRTGGDRTRAGAAPLSAAERPAPAAVPGADGN